MDFRFLPHNTHIEDPASFAETDPHLKVLYRQPLVHRSRLLDEIPRTEPGMYSLTGGRQIGKTTLMKQWMAELLKERTHPGSIAFLTGELIDDHHSLVRLLSDILGKAPEGRLRYVILDEVTYIRDWDRGVKYLADAGMLEDTLMVITGSDVGIIKETRMRLPGRRGRTSKVDFHLYPLSFLEYVELHKRLSGNDIHGLLTETEEPAPGLINSLFEEFQNYLIHGGFLTGINDLESHGRILPSTFSTYSDWVRGDILKRNKQEHYLGEILSAIVKRYGSQVTWNALSRDLSIDHPRTVSDYVELLASMDAVYVQAALMEDKLTGAPKKARKVMFTDPFILHAVQAWLDPCEDPFRDQVQKVLQDAQWCGKLAESCVATHYRRRFPTYYIKAKGEVDIAYVHDSKFWPVEVKWTEQIRPKQLSQIGKYQNGIILTQSRKQGTIQGIPTIPLPLALMRI